MSVCSEAVFSGADYEQTSGGLPVLAQVQV